MDKESKEIVVEINAKDLIDIHSFSYEATIIARLRTAGIPVIGNLLFQGVSNGTLAQEENIMNNSYLFRWKST